MVSLRKNCVAVFLIGFAVGVLLEFFLLEYHRCRTLPRQHQLSADEVGLAGPKVQCLIIVTNVNVTYLTASQETWVKHCHAHHVVKFTRVKTKREAEVQDCKEGGVGEETCAVEVHKWKEVRCNTSWNCLCEALQDLRMRSSHQAGLDWLLITPDHILVLFPNLLDYVRQFNANENYYLGYPISTYFASYNVLSAGILLSKGAFEKFIRVFPNQTSCQQSGKYWNNEDMYLGKHLRELGVTPIDTRDADGRGRFHGQTIHTLLNQGGLYSKTDYHKKALFPVPTGRNCCSPRLITLAPSSPSQMYYYFHFLQHRHISQADVIPNTPQQDFTWQQYLRDNGYSEDQVLSMTQEEYYQVWASKLSPEDLYSQMKSNFKE